MRVFLMEIFKALKQANRKKERGEMKSFLLLGAPSIVALVIYYLLIK